MGRTAAAPGLNPAAPRGAGRPRLPPAEHQRIFTDLIVPFHLGAPEPRRHPVVVYVVGQPGAGKTAASIQVIRGMRKGAVRVSSDDFRAFHPNYAQLLADHPRTAGALLRADYRAWQTAAEEWLRNRRADVVIEAAPATGTDLPAAASRFQAAGYRVEMLLLAVRAADSRQGTAHRFALGLEHGLPARFTTPQGHDRCYRALSELAATLDHHPAVHTVTVTDREVRALQNRQGGTAATLERERQRPYTNTEADRFAAVQHRLWTSLPRHRSELSEITALAAPLLPPGFPLRGLPKGAAERRQPQQDHLEGDAARDGDAGPAFAAGHAEGGVGATGVGGAAVGEPQGDHAVAQPGGGARGAANLVKAMDQVHPLLRAPWELAGTRPLRLLGGLAATDGAVAGSWPFTAPVGSAVPGPGRDR